MKVRWAVTLWVAWRLVRKAPARSALIAVLVALPVLAGTFVAVTIRTAELSPQRAAQRFIGNADAVAMVTPYRFVRPDSAVGYAGGFATTPAQSISPSNGTRTSGQVDLRALLPASARAIPAGWQRYLPVTAGNRRAQVPAVLVDLDDPLTHGMYDVESGRAPRDGQVALTPHLAARLHAGVRSSVVVSGSQETVSAIARNPEALSSDEVLGPATSLGGPNAFPGKYALQDVTWLISFPGHVAPDLHDALAVHGVIYETRAQWEHPTKLLSETVHVNSQGRAILGSVIAFGLAEIILLAGTAFAVGVRRQSRELGLVRAIGGDERDVRRIILSQGVVLGLIGAIVGVSTGFFAFALSRSLLQRIADRAFGPINARATEIAGVAIIGVIAAVLAAIIPARTSAHRSILDMLRTRFRVDKRAVRVPLWAKLALFAGPVLIVGAAAEWHHTSGGPDAVASVSIGGVVGAVASAPTKDARWTGFISIGAAITLAALARACSSLIARLGRHAGRLPLSIRLALRDAARHRHRTAPAAAAVTTVVAGAVLALLVLSSTDINDKQTYRPLIPVGTVSVSGGQHESLQSLTAATHTVATRLGSGPSGVFSVIGGQHGEFVFGVHEPGCRSKANSCYLGPVGVADPTLVDAVAGHSVPAAASALSTGKAIAFDPTVVSSGHVTIGYDGPGHRAPVSLPAVVVPVPRADEVPTVVVSSTTAVTHDWTTFVFSQGLVRPDRLPSQSKADELAASLPQGTGIYVERGYHSGLGVVLLALLAAAGLAVLLGTSIAVALAMTESRPDMATFAAVGASPGRRRRLAMGQAATVGSLGTALGLPLGLLVGISLLAGSTSYPFTLPFRWLALLIVSAPLLAVVVAGAVTRSRVPLTRRLG